MNSNDMSFRDAYDALVGGKIDFFTDNRSGWCEEFMINKMPVDGVGAPQLIPGSFNPLHEAHKWIKDNSMVKNICFEISLVRLGKEELTCEELLARVRQFEDYAPVVITREPRMIGKIGILRRNGLNWRGDAVFHVGMDTFLRMIDDYGLTGIEGLAAKFVVYDRPGAGKFTDLTVRPVNCCQGNSLPAALAPISSTKIREERVTSLEIPVARK